MENNIPPTEMQAKVLEEIKKGRIKIKPKYYFVLKTLIFAVAALLAFTFTIFLISFITFVLRGRGSWFLPHFGWPGIKIFLISFPWILALAALFFVVILEILVNHFGFSYRRPLVYTTLGAVIVVVVAGICIDSTQLHTNALRSASQSNLPVAGALYMNYGLAPIDQIYQGVVSQVADQNDFSIEAPDGQNFNITIPTSTNAKVIQNGEVEKDDRVMIMGEKNGSNIKAFGIQKFNKDQEPLFHQMQRDMHQRNKNGPNDTTKGMNRSGADN